MSLAFRISASGIFTVTRLYIVSSPFSDTLARFQRVLPAHVKEQRGRSSAPRTNHYSFSRDLWPTHPTSWNNLVKPLTAGWWESVLAGTLLARGRKKKRAREEEHVRTHRRTQERERERQDGSNVNANIIEGTKRNETERKRGGTREVKSAGGKVLPPRVTRRKLERERSALATQVYYAIAQGCMCTYVYGE